MKYKNRSVNIMSEINTIKNGLFILCLLCCRFWPMGGGNSCRCLNLSYFSLVIVPF